MARINVVVPPLSSRQYTGGIWCILQYCNGLAARGHEVRIIPILPTPRPRWLTGPCIYHTIPLSARASRILDAWWKVVASLRPGTERAARRGALIATARASTAAIAVSLHRLLPYVLRRGAGLYYSQDLLPDADITVATAYETALPVWLFGRGCKVYFMQHYEVYFANETSHPLFAEKDALLSYQLPLNWITNSAWLRDKLQTAFPGRRASVCNNAIDLENFSGRPKTAPLGRDVKVISYGGRNAIWKGFREMAEAMKLARSMLPDRNIHWMVYGDALIPPDNPIASYETLGFLGPSQLASAYREADVLLSASWYESFPLFTLEAMACGIPIVTTAQGTEEYAIHGETAEIVRAGDPSSIAAGLTRLIADDPYRIRLATAGYATSQSFTWDRSVREMESQLLALIESAGTITQV